MKKTLCFVICISLFLALCGCGGNSESAKSKMPEIILTANDFSFGEHKRSEEYMAAFKTRYVELEGISILFADKVFDETKSPDLAEEIAEFYYSLREISPDDVMDIKVYIVRLTLNDGPMQLGNTLYFNSADMNTVDYKDYMAAAAYNLTEHWKSIGIAGMAEGEAEDFTASRLRKYIEKQGSTNILSLNSCFFIDEFADTETSELARHCAVALTEYVIDKQSFRAFYLDSGSQSRSRWLESMDLYYDLSWLDTKEGLYLSLMYHMEGNDHPLVLFDGVWQLNLEKVDWIEDADELYGFLLSYCRQFLMLLERISVDAPDHFKYVMDTGYMGMVHFRDGDYPTGSIAVTVRGECIVTNPADALHEVTHIVVPYTSPQNEAIRWLSEGLATYLSASYIPAEDDKWTPAYSAGLESSVDFELSEEDFFFEKEIARVFELINGCKIKEAESLKAPVYRVYEAMGIAALLNPDNNSVPAASRPMQENFPLRGKYPGNELSYFEAMVFSAYLVEKYGLDRLISAVMDPENYNSIFPSPAAFEMEFTEFMESVVEPSRAR